MRALVILALLAAVAHAQPAKSQRKQAPDKFTKAAGDAFNAAVAADTKGDLRSALGLYERAFAISPHPSTMFNIADVQRRLSLLNGAIKSYETYLVMSPDARDRGSVEALLETLMTTPGTLLVVTRDASSPNAVDLPAAYALVDGDIKKRPGPVGKVRDAPTIELAVPPGSHVVDLVTPLTYGTRSCDVGPGERRTCEIDAVPRIDGNAVISASDRRFDIKAAPRGDDLVQKRVTLPAGKQRLHVEDRSYGCAPLAIDVGGGNAIAYAFVDARGYAGLRRCRPLDIKLHRLQFEP